MHIDLPIAVGILGAYAGSLYGWLAGRRAVPLLRLCRHLHPADAGRPLGPGGRGRAKPPAPARLEPEAAAGPPRRGRRRGAEVRPEELRAGDVFLARPGPDRAGRGPRCFAEGSFSLASISGEAEPRVFRAGQPVPAGAVSVGRAELRLEALQQWRDSLLARLLASGERAGPAPRVAGEDRPRLPLGRLRRGRPGRGRLVAANRRRRESLVCRDGGAGRLLPVRDRAGLSAGRRDGHDGPAPAGSLREGGRPFRAARRRPQAGVRQDRNADPRDSRAAATRPHSRALDARRALGAASHWCGTASIRSASACWRTCWRPARSSRRRARLRRLPGLALRWALGPSAGRAGEGGKAPVPPGAMEPGPPNPAARRGRTRAPTPSLPATGGWWPASSSPMPPARMSRLEVQALEAAGFCGPHPERGPPGEGPAAGRGTRPPRGRGPWAG